MNNPKNAQEPQPKNLIATIKGWNIQRARELIHKHPGLFSLVTQPEALAFKVEEILPQYRLNPHSNSFPSKARNKQMDDAFGYKQERIRLYP